MSQGVMAMPCIILKDTKSIIIRDISKSSSIPNNFIKIGIIIKIIHIALPYNMELPLPNLSINRFAINIPINAPG